jgi:hypothetical protein
LCAFEVEGGFEDGACRLGSHARAVATVFDHHSHGIARLFNRRDGDEPGMDDLIRVVLPGLGTA